MNIRCFSFVSAPALSLALVLTGCGATSSHTSSTGGSGNGGSPSGGSGGSPTSSASEYLYASAYASGGSIYAWQISSTGTLTPVAGQPFEANIGNGDQDCTEGCGTNLAADPQGRFLYFAYNMNTTSGVDSLGVNASTGALTAISNVPFYPGSTANGEITDTGAISVDPSGQYVYGNTEAGSPPGTTLYLFGFSVSSSGQLTNIAGSPFPMVQGQSGSAISPGPVAVSQNFVFADFLNQSPTGTLQSWSIGSNGALTAVAPPAGGIEGTYPPVVTPSGTLVYASFSVNGAGSNQWEIMPYSIGANGSMTSIPSSAQSLPNESEPIELFLVSPNGKFLYAFGHNATYAYQINGTTGALTPTGTYSNLIAFTAVIDPATKYLYVSPNSGPSSNYVASNNIVGYQIDSSTGALTAISGDTVTLPQSPVSLAVAGPQ